VALPICPDNPALPRQRSEASVDVNRLARHGHTPLCPRHGSLTRIIGSARKPGDRLTQVHSQSRTRLFGLWCPSLPCRIPPCFADGYPLSSVYGELRRRRMTAMKLFLSAPVAVGLYGPSALFALPSKLI